MVVVALGAHACSVLESVVRKMVMLHSGVSACCLGWCAPVVGTRKKLQWYWNILLRDIWNNLVLVEKVAQFRCQWCGVRKAHNLL